MPDWDADSPTLRVNLTNVLRSVRDSARRREVPAVEAARAWQRQIMAGLDVLDLKYVGAFRGEPGLEGVEVTIGSHRGVQAETVKDELRVFERRLRAAVAHLDARYAPDAELDEAGLNDVIEVAAWARAEWVRMHPFANGNGRAARLWANFIFMRYGIPPVIRLRPRPDVGYGSAGAAAMRGDWRPTARMFRRILRSLPPGP